MKVDLEWIYREELEVNRVIYTCVGLANGFYNAINMVILPYDSTSHKANCVVVPEIPYNSIRNFWKQARTFSIIELDVAVSETITESVKEMLEEKSLLSVPKYGQIASDFEKESKNIFRILETIPFTEAKFKRLELYPTKFGTVSSFAHLQSDKVVRAYVREDASILDILISIVAAVVKPVIEFKYRATWWESQMVTYFMISESDLKVYADIEHMQQLQGSRNTPKVISEILREMHLLETIGIAKSHFLSVKDNAIVHKGKELASLSYSEVQALSMLINNYPEAVNHNIIHRALCPGEKYYSKDALYKAVERLRTKLKQSGVRTSILSVRSKGYLLY